MKKRRLIHTVLLTGMLSWCAPLSAAEPPVYFSWDVDGVPRMPVLYAGRLLGKPPSIDEERIAKAVEPFEQRALVVLDIERWHLHGDEHQESIRKLLKVLHLARKARPDLKYGYYGIVPRREYWSTKEPGSAQYRKWQKKNDELAPLVQAVDALFPSLYAFYPKHKPEAWEAYARANLAEARRIGRGKPIYPFVMGHYHNQSTPLSVGFARKQLEVCRSERGVAGVVVWSGPAAQETTPFLEVLAKPTR